MSQCNFGILVSEIVHTKRCKNEAENGMFCPDHQPKGIMSNDATAEIEGRIFMCLKHLEIDAAHVVKMASHISDLAYETEKNRKRLIAEARGILTGKSFAAGFTTEGERTRLREILDELEKLP